MTKELFECALGFLFPSEGGYSNHKADKGGATNMGVTQSTYNAFCSKKNLPQKDVKLITKEEAKQIYYEDYWLISGANKVDNPKMAVALFDTAVLHGPGKAKTFYQQSGGDLNSFLKLRELSYDRIVANDYTQRVFYQGWKNRVNNLRKYVEKV